MKWYKKIIIGVLSLILLVFLLNIGVNLWIKYRLPDLINEKNNSDYAITYKKVEISLLNSSIHANEVVIVPKTALKDTINKAGIYGKVKWVEVKEFKIWSVLFSDRITAKSLTLNTPLTTLYQTDDKAVKHPEESKFDVVKPFEKIISVSDIYLYHGDFKIMRGHKNKAILSISNINLNIDGLKVTDAILKSKIPFEYDKYAISCDSVYYNVSPFYDIITKKIKATSKDLSIAEFKLAPKYNRRQFVKNLKTEKDLFNISAKTITLKNLDWGYNDDDLFVRTELVTINNCHADIYRNKMPADDLTKKYLYNKLLRDLDFELKVDTLKLKNSLVVYEEEKSFDRGSGKLIFNHFYMTATNICSGFKKKKLADLNINIKCRFMNASPLDVAWRLNVMDKTDGFNIKGTLRNFDAEKIVPFTKPYMNVSTKGIIDEVHFNFIGNDIKDSGGFAVKYDDLKFTVYKKDDRKKKNKFLTAIGNLFVKNDTKGKIKEAHVELERIQEKSFYNFLWRSVAEGLKKILI
jgi:hypothetical protein